jgi:hypothetical protein
MAMIYIATLRGRTCVGTLYFPRPGRLAPCCRTAGFWWTAGFPRLKLQRRGQRREARVCARGIFLVRALARLGPRDISILGGTRR